MNLVGNSFFTYHILRIFEILTYDKFVQRLKILAANFDLPRSQGIVNQFLFALVKLARPDPFIAVNFQRQGKLKLFFLRHKPQRRLIAHEFRDVTHNRCRPCGLILIIRRRLALLHFGHINFPRKAFLGSRLNLALKGCAFHHPEGHVGQNVFVFAKRGNERHCARFQAFVRLHKAFLEIRQFFRRMRVHRFFLNPTFQRSAENLTIRIQEIRFSFRRIRFPCRFQFMLKFVPIRNRETRQAFKTLDRIQKNRFIRHANHPYNLTSIF